MQSSYTQIHLLLLQIFPHHVMSYTSHKITLNIIFDSSFWSSGQQISSQVNSTFLYQNPLHLLCLKTASFPPGLLNLVTWSSQTHSHWALLVCVTSPFLPTWKSRLKLSICLEGLLTLPLWHVLLPSMLHQSHLLSVHNVKEPLS